MKAVLKEKEEAFVPVSITLTFETKEELDDFGSLCNWVPMGNALPILSAIWPITKKAGGDIHECFVRERLKKEIARFA